MAARLRSSAHCDCAKNSGKIEILAFTSSGRHECCNESFRAARSIRIIGHVDRLNVPWEWPRCSRRALDERFTAFPPARFQPLRHGYRVGGYFDDDEARDTRCQGRDGVA